MIFFEYFQDRLRPFPHVCGQVKEQLILELHEMIKVPHAVAYPIVSILLYDRGCQIYEEWSFFSICSCFGPFPQVFGKVKEQLLLELHEMIRAPHAVAFPMGFNLFCNRGQQEGVLKPTKNDHFQVFSRLSSFSQVFGQVKE